MKRRENGKKRREREVIGRNWGVKEMGKKCKKMEYCRLCIINVGKATFCFLVFSNYLVRPMLDPSCKYS